MSQSPSPITDLVVHKLIKAPHGPASIQLRSGTNPAADAAARLWERLCRHYEERPGKGYGRFEEDEEAFPMPKLLRAHVVEKSIDFPELSARMMQHLQERAGGEELATGGFVLIARTRDFGTDCLWVAVLTETVGTGIDEALEILDTAHLDFANLRVAGRVNLDAWQKGAERYISFLKGRGDVANYFKLFLGCNDVVLALKETQKLVQTLNQFADTQKLESNVRDELMQRAHVYLDDLGESGEPLTLDRVAQAVWPSAPERLDEALHEASVELASGFVPDRRALRPLVRFKANAEQWKIEFDRNSLRSGAVHYDKASNTLVLSDIPDSLRQMLLEA